MIIIVLIVYNVVLQLFPIFMPLANGLKKWQVLRIHPVKNSLIVSRNNPEKTKCKENGGTQSKRMA
jgi:hypothetical protein